MTTLSSGAVGFAPVGTFVKDLALELGKAPATLVAYLKKHLPTTLTKRKNANNRLANFVTEIGEQMLRSNYAPVQSVVDISSELELLREENARLRALLTDDPNESVESIEQRHNQLESEIELLLSNREQEAEETRETLARADVTIERLEYVADGLNRQSQKLWRETNEIRKQTSKTTERSTSRKPRVTQKVRQDRSYDGSNIISLRQPADTTTD